MNKCVDNKSMCKGPKDQNKCMDSLFCHRRVPWNDVEDTYFLSYREMLGKGTFDQRKEYVEFTNYLKNIQHSDLVLNESDYLPDTSIIRGGLSDEEISRINSQVLQQSYYIMRGMELNG